MRESQVEEKRLSTRQILKVKASGWEVQMNAWRDEWRVKRRGRRENLARSLVKQRCHTRYWRCDGLDSPIRLTWTSRLKETLRSLRPFSTGADLTESERCTSGILSQAVLLLPPLGGSKP